MPFVEQLQAFQELINEGKVTDFTQFTSCFSFPSFLTISSDLCWFWLRETKHIFLFSKSIYSN